MVTRFSSTNRLAGLTLIILALSLAGPDVARADFDCRAEVNRASVPQGGNLELTVSAEGDVGWDAEFILPNIPQARVHAGGTNQSMTMVNGRTRTSIARTWYLVVESPDDFTIEPVTVKTPAGQCRTEALTIQVTPPVPPKAIPPVDTGNREPRSGNIPTDGPQGGKAGDDVFVTLDVDRDDVYVGQQIILTFRYWRRVQPWNNPSYEAPRTEGFWREDLGSEKNFRRAVQGRSYTVTEIRYALFPTRSGTLTIEPGKLTFPAGVFDRFFNSSRRPRGPQELKTRAIPVKVKDLPQPRPAGFSQIVASNLQLRAFADRDSVPRGEAVGLKIQLAADGFLKGFAGLQIPAPAGSRLHDASESFESRPEGGRIVGRMAVEKVVIPNTEGLLEIPEITLAWFNTTTGNYETARTPVLEVMVLPSDRPTAEEESSGFLRNEIARLGEDLAFIHRAPDSLRRGGDSFTGGVAWWLLLLAPLLALGGVRIYLNRIAAARRDPAGRRRRLALATARTGLTRSRELANSDARCEAVARVITGYAADCTGRPVAGLTATEIRELGRTVHADRTGERLADILEQCDFSRFGGFNVKDHNALTEEVESLLETLDQALKRSTPGGPTGAGSAFALVLVLSLGLVWPGAAAAQAAVAKERPGADPVRLVAESNQAYTEGQLDQALRGYLEARSLGVNDPVLHFNLGNTYARQGQLGQAVASYLRAQRLAPRDRDIQTNLDWVRRNIQDLELTENELPLFVAQIAGLIRAFTLDQWGWIVVVAAWLVAVLVGWGWYRETFGSHLRRYLLAATALLLAAAVITAGRWYREEVRDEAVVIVPAADVKSGPAEDFPVLFQVHDGLTVNIDSRREGWVRIGMGGEWRGWLPATSVVRVRLDSDGTQGR